MEKEKVYYAHPVNVYDTELEKQTVKLIEETLRVVVENPNQPHHQVGYKVWKDKYDNDPAKSGGMSYFYEEVLPKCQGCVCQIFMDGKWGLGVAGEAGFFIEKGQPVWVLEPEDNIIRPITAEEESLVATCDPRLVLSREETRRRTWVPGKLYQEKLPYDKSHLI